MKNYQMYFISLLFLLFPFHPVMADNPPKPRVEVTFVLDATGSMSGLIQTAKEKIWSIATNLTQADPEPDISIGLIAYRDRGDVFVTKFIQLTDDLDKVYNELMSLRAGGGGDGPESVNQALFEAVSNIHWSYARNTYRSIFLVGDYPPHMDYQDDIKYHRSCEIAGSKGIVINTIQMGNYSGTTPIWMEIARLTNGEYFKVNHSANGFMVSTPYDDKITRKSLELDQTRIYYGSKKQIEVVEEKTKTADAIYSKASKPALARRAVYNTTSAGMANFLGSNELVYDYANNEVKLEQIKKQELPKNMQEMTLTQQKAYLKEKQMEREKIIKEIRELEEQRQAYINEQLEKTADKGENTFTVKVYETVKTQAKSKGLIYTKKAKH